MTAPAKMPDRYWLKGTVINNGPAILIDTEPRDGHTEFVRADLAHPPEAPASRVTPEMEAKDAPVWFSAEQASAWADGYNACRAALIAALAASHFPSSDEDEKRDSATLRADLKTAREALAKVDAETIDHVVSRIARTALAAVKEPKT